MDKTCEYCMSMSPIVYCKADAAHLCLCCDAKVHSANSLSFRHPRTLVCESCRYQPTHVRCLEHEMFMCHSCDVNNHVSFQHQKKVIVVCYVGCPSAKDLAELWGFKLNKTVQLCDKTKARSSHRGKKVFKDGNTQRNSFLILQQIQELEKLQLSEVEVKDRTCGLQPFEHENIKKIQTENFDPHLDFQRTSGSNLEKPLCWSPFSQIEDGEESSFWQSKSPVLNNEIWLQNMQDLGVCDELQSFDNDVNIPDVDLTFRNFEELFEKDDHDEANELIFPSFLTQKFP